MKFTKNILKCLNPITLINGLNSLLIMFTIFIFGWSDKETINIIDEIDKRKCDVIGNLQNSDNNENFYKNECNYKIKKHFDLLVESIPDNIDKTFVEINYFLNNIDKVINSWCYFISIIKDNYLIITDKILTNLLKVILGFIQNITSLNINFKLLIKYYFELTYLVIETSPKFAKMSIKIIKLFINNFNSIISQLQKIDIIYITNIINAVYLIPNGLNKFFASIIIASEDFINSLQLMLSVLPKLVEKLMKV